MADISRLSRLIDGVQRNVDLSINTLVVDKVKVGGGSGTDLSQTILDKLVNLQNGTDFATGTNSHTHDGRYFTETELGSSSASSGSDLVGDDATYSNFTPAAATVKGALSGIDAALAAGNGQVKITAADTTAQYLGASIVAGSALTSTILNPGANETLSMDVAVDNSTIEVNADALRVKDAGITDAKVATGIDAAKLADGSVSNAELQFINTLSSNAQTQLTNNATAISDHLSDTVDAHDASAISSVAAGNLVATDVQAALNELDSEKVAKSGDTMSGNLAMGTNKVTGLGAGTTAGDAVRYEQAILASGVNAFTAAQSMGGFKLTSVADPTVAQDAATKAYVDSLIDGRDWKNSVKAATTAALTLATDFENGDAIDGITLATNDRILVKDQASAAENGIYIVQASGAPVRSTDADAAGELVGAAVFVEQGTANGDKQFAQTGDGVTFAINSVWVVTSANSFSGHDMITLSGGQISVDLTADAGLESSNAGNAAGQLRVKLDSTTLTRTSSGLKVSTGGITNTEVNTSAAIAYSKLNIADGDLTIAKTNGLQTALDGKVDENAAITGATNTKITYDAKGLVTAGAAATTADINDSTNRRYVTDADLVDIGNLSGTNTGDQTITLTGDVTGTGTGSFATTIAANAVTTTKILDANVTLAKLASDSVDENKIVSTTHDASMSGGSGSKLSVAYAPKGLTSTVAGESMAANTSFLVRWALTGETAGRVYKADKDASVSDKFYAIGIALKTTAVSAADAVDVCFEGSHTLGSSDTPFAGADVGKPVYLTAAGAFSITAPTTANEAVWRVGVVQATNKVWVGMMQLNGIN